MGFGSYDESEQRDVDTDFDEQDAVQTSDTDHEGTIHFENGASSDELLDRLKEIKGE